MFFRAESEGDGFWPIILPQLWLINLMNTEFGVIFSQWVPGIDILS